MEFRSKKVIINGIQWTFLLGLGCNKKIACFFFCKVLNRRHWKLIQKHASCPYTYTHNPTQYIHNKLLKQQDINHAPNEKFNKIIKKKRKKTFSWNDRTPCERHTQLFARAYFQVIPDTGTDSDRSHHRKWLIFFF